MKVQIAFGAWPPVDVALWIVGGSAFTINHMEFTKDINEMIRQQARLIQDEFGMAALTQREIYDAAAQRAVDNLTPLQIGQVLHPGCRGVALADVPPPVIEEHRRRYTDEDLRQGQFVVVTGSREHFVFIMGHETKRRKDAKTNDDAASHKDRLHG